MATKAGSGRPQGKGTGEGAKPNGEGTDRGNEEDEGEAEGEGEDEVDYEAEEKISPVRLVAFLLIAGLAVAAIGATVSELMPTHMAPQSIMSRAHDAFQADPDVSSTRNLSFYKECFLVCVTLHYSVLYFHASTVVQYFTEICTQLY